MTTQPTQEAPSSVVEQAVQAAIDAGVAENGKYGVAAARVAARFILEQQRKDQTWSMIKDTTDNHDVALEARPAPSSDVVEGKCPYCGSITKAVCGVPCSCVGALDALASTAGDTLKAENEVLRERLREARKALWTFGKPETLEQLYEEDEEWAKFRFLVKDYRRAGRAIEEIDKILARTALGSDQ